jgi:hypothetical protein
VIVENLVVVLPPSGVRGGETLERTRIGYFVRTSDSALLRIP